MNAPTPGWYPDPQRPDLVRWFDGTVWTAHVAPAAPGGPGAALAAAPRRRSAGMTALVITLSVLGVLFVVGILAAIAIPVFLNQQKVDAFREAVDAQSCERVEDDWTRLSVEDPGPGERPVASMDLAPVDDERATVQRPGAGIKVHVLTCEGILEDDRGDRSFVRIEVRMDRDGQGWLTPLDPTGAGTP